jgi:putative transposase
MYLKKKYKTGLKTCCEVMRLSRSSLYYESKLDDTELIEKLQELVSSHPNRGFDNYYGRIRQEGHRWARSRVLRVYREMGLVRRPKRRRRLPEAERKPLSQPANHNEVWSMDYMSDSLEDGRKMRILNVIDDYNRECLMSIGSISFPSIRVVRELERVGMEIGFPKYIRTDNGPEFRSEDYTRWCKKRKITPVYSSPGKPMENGYVERFNRTFREDILDAYLFRSIAQFNIIADKWKEDYNSYHPHGGLGSKSPKEYKGGRNQPLYGDLNPHIGAEEKELFKL